MWCKDSTVDPEPLLQPAVHKGIGPSCPEYVPFLSQPSAFNSQAAQTFARPAAQSRLHSGSQVMSDFSTHYFCCLACIL